MKICVVRHGYSPDDARDRKEILALLEKGHSVDVICLRKKKGQFAREECGDANIIRIPIVHKRGCMSRYFFEYGASFIIISIVLLYLHLRKRYDCIQVSTLPDFLVFTTIIPKILGAKVVLDLHEPTPELWITKYGSHRLRFLLKAQIWLEQLAIRYSDACITVTETLRKRFGGRGANKIYLTQTCVATPI